MSYRKAVYAPPKCGEQHPEGPCSLDRGHKSPHAVIITSTNRRYQFDVVRWSDE